MAAPLGFKTFNTGDVLSAADTNGYLMQGVLVFADAAARTAAITSPQEGQTSYLKDTDVIQVYSGAAWVTKSGGSSPLTTKGDLYTFGTGDTRLGVGANGTTLVADSSTATGLAWSAPAAGGGLTLIQETVANANSSITFGSIPGTYKQLLLTFHGLYQSNNTSAFSLRFNNSSTSEYSQQSWGFNNATPAIQVSSSTTTSVGMPTGLFGEAVNATAAYETATGSLLIDNYASSTKKKMYYGSRAYFFNAGMGEKQYHSLVGSWGNTSAITSLDVFRSQGAGTLSNLTDTSIRLYGIS